MANLAPADATRFLKTLRARRFYSERPVAPEDLAAVLEVARWTGSSRNRQPWQLVVVRDRATRERLAPLGNNNTHFARAQVVIVPLMEDRGSGGSAFDLGRLVQNILLGAHARGLASNMASFSTEDFRREAARILEVPAGWAVEHGVAIGWPREEADPARPGAIAGRKPLVEIVHYERFGRRSP